MSNIVKLPTEKYQPWYECNECEIYFSNKYNWNLPICPHCYSQENAVFYSFALKDENGNLTFEKYKDVK